MLRLIRQLPQFSRYYAALVNDEEYVTQALRAMEDQPDSEKKNQGISLTEFTPEVAALARVEDLLQNILGVTIAAAGGKAPKFKPAPRPRTAFSAVREKKARAAHNKMVSRVTIKQPEPPVE